MTEFINEEEIVSKPKRRGKLLTASDLVKNHTRAMFAAEDGEMTPAQATALSNMHLVHAELLKLADLSERLDKLESTTLDEDDKAALRDRITLYGKQHEKSEPGLDRAEDCQPGNTEGLNGGDIEGGSASVSEA